MTHPSNMTSVPSAFLTRIYPSVETLVDHLVQRGVLDVNSEDYQEIMHIMHTPLSRSRMLLRVLARLGPEAVAVFREVLATVLPDLPLSTVDEYFAQVLSTGAAAVGCDDVDFSGRENMGPIFDSGSAPGRDRDDGRSRGRENGRVANRMLMVVANMRKAHKERALRARSLDYCRSPGEHPEGLEKVYISLSAMSLRDAVSLKSGVYQNGARHDEVHRLLKQSAKEIGSVEELLRRGGVAVKMSLLVGQPGSGKTMTSDKILADWGLWEGLRGVHARVFVSAAVTSELSVPNRRPAFSDWTGSAHRPMMWSLLKLTANAYSSFSTVQTNGARIGWSTKGCGSFWLESVSEIAASSSQAGQARRSLTWPTSVLLTSTWPGSPNNV